MLFSSKVWLYLTLLVTLAVGALSGCSKPDPDGPAKMLGVLPTQSTN